METIKTISSKDAAVDIWVADHMDCRSFVLSLILIETLFVLFSFLDKQDTFLWREVRIGWPLRYLILIYFCVAVSEACHCLLYANIFCCLQLLQSGTQDNSNSDYAFAIDIWSLGCTIIEMMTGKPPWSEYEGVSRIPCSMFCINVSPSSNSKSD